MHPFRRKRRNLTRWLALAVGVGLSCLGNLAQAQNWPTKPIRLIVGFPAGGTADVIARLLAEGMRERLGQPVVVDNKPGIAGAIAAAELVASPADGYTFLVAVSGLVSEVPHFAKIRFDPFKDVKPLAELASGGLVLVGSSDLPARNMKELANYLKATAGQLSFASYSAGTISHTLGLQLNKALGLNMIHIPYRGSPPALLDVSTGRVQIMFDGAATSIPLINSGKLRAYAVTSPVRLIALPDVPTIAEAGFPDLSDVIWMGLWTTPDVPGSVQERVRNATIQTLAQPNVKSKLTELGLNPGSPITSAELSAKLIAASNKQGSILRTIGITPQ